MLKLVGRIPIVAGDLIVCFGCGDTTRPAKTAGIGISSELADLWAFAVLRRSSGAARSLVRRR